MLAYILFSTAAFWILYTLWILAALATTPPLRAPPSTADVHVAMAARNEQQHVAAAAHAMLQQSAEPAVCVGEGPSTDATRAILEGIEHPRLRIVDAQAPEGWLGKCYALHLAGQGDAPWILFTDADVVCGRELLARTLGEAEATGADHVVVYPRQRVRTIWGQAAQFAIGQGVATMAPGWMVRRGWAVAGIGHWNLVRRSIYEAGGGHEALRMEVVDDVGIGRLVRSQGGRTIVRSGQDAITTDWAQTLPECLRAMEKNAFAGFGYRRAWALLASAFFLTAWGFGATGWAWFVAGEPWGLAATAAWGAYALPAFYQTIARRGWGPSDGTWGQHAQAALLVPLAFAVIPTIILRSMWKSRRGIAWRGSTYSLEALRAGRYRPGLSRPSHARNR